MPDVTLTYKGQTILELDESGTRNIKLSGKYCEDDIELTYVRHKTKENITSYFAFLDYMSSLNFVGIVEVGEE